MSVNRWKIAAASAASENHLRDHTPCQDAHAVEASANGQWLAMVVADGTGTAPQSDEGASIVARAFAAVLIRLTPRLEEQRSDALINDEIIRGLIAVRDQLRAHAGTEELRDYQCTLNALLLGPTGGLSVQIGDGGYLAGSASRASPRVVDFADDYLVSDADPNAQNQGLAFVTDRAWARRLRIASLPKVDWAILGTETGMSLTITPQRTARSQFVGPAFQTLLTQRDNDERDVHALALLAATDLPAVAADDRTLIWVCRVAITTVDGSFTPRLNGRVARERPIFNASGETREPLAAIPTLRHEGRGQIRAPVAEDPEEGLPVSLNPVAKVAVILIACLALSGAFVLGFTLMRGDAPALVHAWVAESTASTSAAGVTSWRTYLAESALTVRNWLSNAIPESAHRAGMRDGKPIEIVELNPNDAALHASGGAASPVHAADPRVIDRPASDLPVLPAANDTPSTLVSPSAAAPSAHAQP